MGCSPSSTQRQYSVLYQLGIVRFDNEAKNWKAIQLIDTADNKRAVEMARDPLQHGEAVQAKEAAVVACGPDPTRNYRTPVQTIRPARRRTAAPPKVIAAVIGIALSYTPRV
jgi:hypothetical protein